MELISDSSTFLDDLSRLISEKQIVQVRAGSNSFLNSNILSLIYDQKFSHIKSVVVVLPNAKESSLWFHGLIQTKARYSFWQHSVDLFPSYSCWGEDRYVNHVKTHKYRLATLANLYDADRKNIVVTTITALKQYTLPKIEFENHLFTLETSTEYDLDEVINSLEKMGYQKCAKVESVGYWALRGGILDFFPPNFDEPIRIEFVGDEIESIRKFDIDTQTSKSTIESLQIFPASECLIASEDQKKNTQILYESLLEQGINQHDREGMISSFSLGVRFSGFDMFYPIFRSQKNTILEYFSSENTLFLFPKIIADCMDHSRDDISDYNTLSARDKDQFKPNRDPSDHFCEEEQFINILSKFKKLEYGNPYDIADSGKIRLSGALNRTDLPLLQDDKSKLFDEWVGFLQKKSNNSLKYIILCENESHLNKAYNLLIHRKLSVITKHHIFKKIVCSENIETGIYLGFGQLEQHLWLEKQKILIIPDWMLFGKIAAKKVPASKQLKDFLSSFKDLKVNDFVVHLTHGIGQYLGMSSLDVGGVKNDFLIIQYQGADKIYLPVDKLNLLQKYSAGQESSKIPLDKLGSQNWIKKKSKVSKAIKDIADELLRLQAKRYLARPHNYNPPDETYIKFVEDFPYEETEDQLRVIDEVGLDLQSEKAMDRLIVGDVGFGKTEVALRATMRAVLEGYTVLVLVPTTVLCYQHYHTFLNRLSRYGVNVAQINRFVKGKQLKETLQKLEAGKLDVLVGTHRLLSKDVKINNLGLLIVDEEQRFGVTHKERIKEVRASADVLTLSATPIPRTLHMAMLGLRDISIIATPPYDRLPVKTYISKFDESLIKDSIEREIARGGQVFYVHNRVESIYEVQAFIQKLVPQAETRVGHGQMSEKELESVIFDFIEQKFSILVCTTIIESGIDMPNVNTIFVERADKFGLAQLYQLRGRVGRSSAQGFAYFLTSKSDAISEDGRRRLDVLVTHQDLGSGFQIASHDLDLRGAGNLLGSEQSGHVATVGLELYTEMLETVIKSLRGEKTTERKDIEIKLNVSALIPSVYIEVESERLQTYRQLFSAESEHAIDKIVSSTSDRYGPIPDEFTRLTSIAKIREKLNKINVSAIAPGRGGFIELTFRSLQERQIAKMIEIVNNDPMDYRLTADYKLILSVKSFSNLPVEKQGNFLINILKLLEPLVIGLGVEE